ncbi:hypothetical protein PNOK_0674700 [Pyrrhoderma noxium]|uniref:Uncharacterized protein n=1 Tax=Pyrrhoderma noxium TaxID=2282107 RepID=A0A286UF87_9AGAM|nr:hypothetical protein PNOK_0674700 [Pyrrhoderma noxium]
MILHPSKKKKRRKEADESSHSPVVVARISSEIPSPPPENSCCSRPWIVVESKPELENYFAGKIAGGVKISIYHKQNTDLERIITYRCKIPRDQRSVFIAITLPLVHANDRNFLNKLKQKLDKVVDDQTERNKELEIEAENSRLAAAAQHCILTDFINMAQTPKPQLSLQAKRWRTIIITLPIIGATSFVLYQRLVQGKPQRTIARPEAETQGTSIEKNL